MAADYSKRKAANYDRGPHYVGPSCCACRHRHSQFVSHRTHYCLRHGCPVAAWGRCDVFEAKPNVPVRRETPVAEKEASNV